MLTTLAGKRQRARQANARKPEMELLEARLVPAVLGEYIARWEMDHSFHDHTNNQMAVFHGGDADFVHTFDHQFGSSLQLDGTDDYLDVSVVADDVTTGFTFSAWVQTDSGSSARTLLGVNTAGGVEVFALTIAADNSLTVIDGTTTEASTASPLADGSLHHVAYTLNGTVGRLFVDGVEQATHQAGYTLTATDQWSLGQQFNGSGPANFMNGVIDEVRFYEEALTAEQIVGLYTHPTDTNRQGEHAALLNLLPSTTADAIAVQNGLWSDPNTWGGTLPQANQYVYIPNGVHISYDTVSDVSLRGVRVDGMLHFRTDVNTRMVVDTHVSTPGSMFTMGTASDPVQPGVTAEILIDASRGAIDTHSDPTLLGRGIITHGTVRIHGATKAAHTPLAVAPQAGDSLLSLESAPANWQAGDLLVLAGTYHDKDGSDADNTRFHDEVLEITAINGTIITFINRTNATVDGTTTLAFDHLPPDGLDDYDLRVHVGNLTRNVTVRTLDADNVPTQQRGHVMFMHSPDVQVSHAAFRDLGRTDKNRLIDDVRLDEDGNFIPGSGTNPRGRYGVHFHRTGVHSLNSTPARATGNVIWGSPGWGLVQHDSHAILEDNVVFDVVGSAIVAEDGNEIGRWSNNFTVKTTGDDRWQADFDGSARVGLFDFGFNGEGYWLQGAGQILVENNIAASAAGGGINLFSNVDGMRELGISPDLLQDPSIGAGFDLVDAYNVPARGIRGMVVYNSDFGIITWGHMRNQDGEGPFTFAYHSWALAHSARTTIEDFLLWNIYGEGIFTQYTSQTDFVNGLVVGNEAAPIAFRRGINGDGRGNGVSGNSPAKNLTYDNLLVAGFHNGLHVLEEASFGEGDPHPLSASAVRNSTFRSVRRAITANVGFPDDPTDTIAMPEYYEISNTTFSLLPGISTVLPTAAFMATDLGGRGYEFDAASSFDTDLPPGVNGDGIVSYAWDFDNDGVIDDYGVRVRNVFPTTGPQTVSLTVYNSQGITDTTSQSIDVALSPFVDPFLDSNFNAPGDFFDPVYRPRGSADEGDGWAIWDTGWFKSGGVAHVGVPNVAYPNIPNGLTQVVRNERIHRGDFMLSVDIRNLDRSGDPNQFRILLHGVNGTEFLHDPTEPNAPIPMSAIPLESSVTLLNSGDLADGDMDWTTFSFPVSLGEGYDYLVVQLLARDVDYNNGDRLMVDNVQLSETGNVPGISTSALPVANVGESYSQSLMANGGDGVLSWQVLTGDLPSGITLNSNGILSGTPSATGTYSFTVQVMDSDGDSDSADLQMIVTADSTPTITTASVTDAEAFTPYGFQLQATGGDGTLSWNVTSGMLPGGVTLSSTGNISGTPEQEGQFVFTVTVTDMDGDSDSQEFTLFVNVDQPSFLLPDGFSATTVAADMGSVTAMAIAPDGRIFVVTQNGEVRVIENGNLLADPFLTIEVDDFGERGLLGIAFDPDFANNRFVYLYHTLPASVSGPQRNRVTRVTADGNSALPGSATTIFDLDPIQGPGYHNGGALHFGPDGMLYIAVGDDTNPANSQSLTTTAGKMLRIRPDGTIPEDNPFYNETTGIHRSIWALGLRNPFTFGFDPATGQLFINDVGEGEWEEINVGVAGGNYGWPGSEGPTNDPNYISPLHAYGHGFGPGEGFSVTGGVFYSPDSPNFPSQYQGTYFFSDFVTGFIQTLDPTTGAVGNFVTGMSAGNVDLDVGPDGTLYVLTRSIGAVIAIRHAQDEAPDIARQPVDISVDSGQPATFSVEVTGTGPFTYQWQRNGDDIPGATSVSFTLNPVSAADDGAGFRVIVSNAFGTIISDAATLTVLENTAPVPVIETPTAGTTFAYGQTFTFSGSATDNEDGTLPASAFTWRVDYITGSAPPRPFVPPTSGVTQGSFTLPATTPYQSVDVSYRIYLSVTDSDGAVSETFVELQPRVADVTVSANVAGIPITLDGQPVEQFMPIATVVGLERTVVAPTEFEVDGVVYIWQSWSNGQSASHTFVTPETDLILSAEYEAQPVVNNPPEIAEIADRILNVSDTLNVTGGFDDPDSQDWTATVDYDDGGGAQPLSLNADMTFALQHSYATAGTYSVTVAITDDSGNTTSEAFNVSVTDEMPSLGVRLSAQEEDGIVGLSLKARVSGITNPQGYPVRVDWGDGNTETIPINSDGYALGQHSYSGAGTYPVRISAGVSTTTESVSYLLVIGKNGRDNIFVSAEDRTQVTVNTQPDQSLDLSHPDSRVILFGRNGRDFLSVDGTIPAELFGNNGRDILFGGDGLNVLRGGDGHDILYGAGEDDILIGGYGRDFLYGKRGNDILIGGETDRLFPDLIFDLNLWQLAKMDWLAALFASVDDPDGRSERDVLSGHDGRDLFVARIARRRPDRVDLRSQEGDEIWAL